MIDMDREIFDRFDMVMSALKAIEPTPSFDFEFRRRLNEVIEKKYEASAFELMAERVAESFRYALLPKVPVLVRSAATFIVLMAIGLYIYSVQPSNPLSLHKEGVVLAMSPKDAAWREVVSRERLKVGDIIMTERDSQIDLVLFNKYAIRMKAGTKLRIEELTPRYGKGRARFSLLEGKMLASIGTGFKSSSFIIDTEAAVAKALGTKFVVNIQKDKNSKTDISVLEGEVEVESRFRPKEIFLAKRTVIVGAGQKTEVYVGQVPLTPQRLLEEEWRQLEELYQIGKKPTVMLLLRNTTDRVEQLLRPCPIYISDEKPIEIPEIFEDIAIKIGEAVKTQDKAKHLESVRLLEKMIKEYPNPKYDVQFLLYIGAYYEYLSDHKEAVRIFEKVLENYPNSTLASLAQCAIGIIYEEKLNNKEKADMAYRLVLTRYPNSLEAIWVEKRLGIKKLANNIK
ncbi:MAG: hypothetical protein A2Z72_00980 [Omnitrophica bacterium RBG_13_46_9]|nr:MAG: hypothetical protein A2Z72_00980 [Omnitrophica bacterium RBG_13_46_9]